MPDGTSSIIWPVDYSTEILRRSRFMMTLTNDPRLRAGAMAFYATHPKEWINDWAITYDPRRVPAILPFVLFPRQEDALQFILECLEDKEGGLFEKSRDMGLTWLCAAISVWLWLFRKGSSVGFGSRDQDTVDKSGDPDSIFEKIRMIIENLPWWMRPRGFNKRLHSSFMKLVNPANKATIKGDAGKNIGRGGRSTIYFKDESAHYENPEAVEAALGQNTNVQIDISSVHGSANVFYRRRWAGQIWERGKKIAKGITRVFIFDWRDHPGKSLDWYTTERAKYEREGLLHIFAQEVDRDYAASLHGIIIKPEWVRACIDAHKVLGLPEDGDIIAGQDIADGGGDKNALLIRQGIIMRYADHWAGEAGDAPGVAFPKCEELKVRELYYDSVGVGSGFKTTVKNMKENNLLPKKLRVLPWNGGSSVLDPTEHIIPGDSESPTNEEQFGNLKAQAWLRMRARVYKTYRAVTKGEKYPWDELISIPSDLPLRHQVEMELSQAVIAPPPPKGKGKTYVDKKPDGSLSPNLADAAVIAYCPTREISILDVL